jgi:hypothetical protein
VLGVGLRDAPPLPRPGWVEVREKGGGREEHFRKQGDLMRTRGLLLALLLPSWTVLGGNLLTNPGFEQDLSGWSLSFSPDPPSPRAGSASLVWTSVGSPGSPGAVELRARSEESSVRAAAGQCFAVMPGSLATIEARFLVRHQRMVARASVELASFASEDCSGGALATERADALPFHAPSIDFGGEWLEARLAALVPLDARSVKAEVSATASTTSRYGSAEIDAVADDAVLTLDEVQTTTWVLPSSAWGSGTSESRWTTFLTLANPTPRDANVTLRWLGHDVDGRGGIVESLVVPGGRTVSPDLEEWELNLRGSRGAILVTATVKELVVQGETSTRLSGGSVGQVVPAFGPADCAGRPLRCGRFARRDARRRAAAARDDPDRSGRHRSRSLDPLPWPDRGLDLDPGRTRRGVRLAHRQRDERSAHRAPALCPGLENT